MAPKLSVFRTVLQVASPTVFGSDLGPDLGAIGIIFRLISIIFYDWKSVVHFHKIVDCFRPTRCGKIAKIRYTLCKITEIDRSDFDQIRHRILSSFRCEFSMILL